MKKLRITIGKKTYDVTVEVLDDGTPKTPLPGQSARAAGRAAPPAESAPSAPAAAPATAGAGAVVSPMAGVIKSVLVKQGDDVEKGQAVAVLEAMKMENQVSASESGTVERIDVAEGQSVTEGQVLMVIG